MQKDCIYAHSLKGKDCKSKQSLGGCCEKREGSLFWARPGEELQSHLYQVSEMAASFAKVFGGEEIARACGLLHDIGKYSNEFQDYMRRIMKHEKASRGETIHALQGALYAYKHFKDIGIADIIVNIVASHHGELLDMLDENGRASTKRLGEKKTRRGNSILDLYEQALTKPEACALVNKINEELLKCELNALIKKVSSAGLGYFGIQLFIRMIYSSLVDADRCDAAGYDGQIEEPPWGEIETAIDQYMVRFKEDTPLNKVRGKISKECLHAGSRECGIHTLSVPTGGGKTLSSLRFAICHAKCNHLKRVVYVIPYLSIIDQTAKELRSIFGMHAEDWLLEHHSNVIMEEADDEGNNERRMLTERWDRPIVVTTMVRFMETILSNRSSDVRKLHNMTEAVFIFDEIQSLPIRCIYLFNMTINFLCQICGASAVLCTATLPTWTKVEKAIALSKNHALVKLSDTERTLFKRVKFVKKTDSPMSLSEIGLFINSFLEENQSVLVVLNTKKSALSVYNSCNVPKDSDKLYLTTDLCAQHRRDNIEHIRANMRESKRKPLLCVSTQLIEAGVDLSFDVVIRANAGIDNIIQAGGRCNRNGEHKTCQSVYVIEVAEENLARLPGIVAAKEATRRALNDFPDSELSDACVMERFYTYLLANQNDEMVYPILNGAHKNESIYGILDSNIRARKLYKQLNQGHPYQGSPAAFATAANAFHMIEGEQIAVVVPYAPYRDEIMGLISEFKRTFEPKMRVKILRQLQPYTVSIYAHQESWLQEISEKICDTFYLVGEGFYNAKTGLTDKSFELII